MQRHDSESTSTVQVPSIHNEAYIVIERSLHLAELSTSFVSYEQKVLTPLIRDLSAKSRPELDINITGGDSINDALKVEVFNEVRMEMSLCLR